MSPDDKAMLKALLERGDELSLKAADRFATYHRMDCEAGNYVECVIAMRTGFTGDPPYVGWRGLGLALNEALDVRDRLREALQLCADLIERVGDSRKDAEILEEVRAALKLAGGE